VVDPVEVDGVDDDDESSPLGVDESVEPVDVEVVGAAFVLAESLHSTTEPIDVTPMLTRVAVTVRLDTSFMPRVRALIFRPFPSAHSDFFRSDSTMRQISLRTLISPV